MPTQTPVRTKTDRGLTIMQDLLTLHGQLMQDLKRPLWHPNLKKRLQKDAQELARLLAIAEKEGLDVQYVGDAILEPIKETREQVMRRLKGKGK